MVILFSVFFLVGPCDPQDFDFDYLTFTLKKIHIDLNCASKTEDKVAYFVKFYKNILKL